MSNAKTNRSFSTVNITNILDQAFTQEYTDPLSPLEKVEVHIEAGETITLSGIVGDVVASDIAGVYLAGKGLSPFGTGLTETVAKIKGITAKPAQATKKASPIKNNVVVDEPEETPNETDPEETPEETPEGEPEGEPETGSDTPATTATGKAKVKR